MPFVQLDPPIPLDIIGRGKGLALAVIDYGAEHNLLWVTVIDATGEIWCAPNPLVRAQKNWSMGRACVSPAVDPCSCESDTAQAPIAPGYR